MNKDTMKKILTLACVYFTAVTVLLVLIYLIIGGNSAMHPVAQLLIFPAAFCFATAKAIFESDKVETITKFVCHYCLVIGGIWFLLYLPNKAPDVPGSSSLIFFVLVNVVYFIVMFVKSSLRGRHKKLERDTSKYKSVYKKK